MQLDITGLLEIRTWRAFDVDDDGRVLAGFDETGSVQLVELAGPQPKQPKQPPRPLTALPGACHGRYLPGERAVVVEHDDGGNERGQLSLLRLDPGPAEPVGPGGPVGLAGLEPLVHDSRYVHRLLDVLPGRVVYATNRRNRVDFDVVIRNVVTGVEQVIYDSGGWAQAVTVSADAQWVLTTLAGAAPMSDRLVLVNTMAETEGERVIELTGDRPPGRQDGARWLGAQHAFVVATDSETDMAAVVRYDLDTASWQTMVGSTEHDLMCWPSPDSRLLLVEANDDGISRLALHDGATGERLRDVELPTEGVITFPQPDPVWAPDSRLVAISFTAPGVPGEVLLLDTTSDQPPVPLTSSADQLAASVVSTPSSHRVPTPDGELVPCLVYPPTVAESTVDGSAVMVIHGGPEGQSRPAFSPVVQAMAAAGHTVVVPNVRGSVGYGKRWYSADDVRKRPDSVADLAALRDWLPSLGLDPARVALWGGSYGGYMVLAGLAFQPESWAAGVDIVGISSLVTFLQNTSPYRRAAREREYGSLEADLQFLRDASPLSRVDAISAPLFVIHGANDPRVPLSEAQQLAAAVRDNGVECELLVYPDEGHGLAKRANRLDAYPKALSFLARHLEPGGARARTP